MAGNQHITNSRIWDQSWFTWVLQDDSSLHHVVWLLTTWTTVIIDRIGCDWIARILTTLSTLGARLLIHLVVLLRRKPVAYIKNVKGFVFSSFSCLCFGWSFPGKLRRGGGGGGGQWSRVRLWGHISCFVSPYYPPSLGSSLHQFWNPLVSNMRQRITFRLVSTKDTFIMTSMVIKGGLGCGVRGVRGKGRTLNLFPLISHP